MLLNDQPTPLMSALGTPKSLVSCMNESLIADAVNFPETPCPCLTQ